MKIDMVGEAWSTECEGSEWVETEETLRDDVHL